MRKEKRSVGGYFLVALFAGAVICAAQSVVSGQQPAASNGSKNAAQDSITADYQKRSALKRSAAIDLLKSTVQDLRKHFDEPEAISAAAKVADMLWNIDEQYSRDIFSRAFEAASRPAANISTVDKALRNQQLLVERRKAQSLSVVLRLLGKHDQKLAENLLAKYKSEITDTERSKDSGDRSELLAQMALDIASTKPEESTSLAILALSGVNVPESMSQLLFTLSRQGHQYSDAVFSATLQNLQRNNYPYSNVLNGLFNYLFYSDGRLVSKESATSSAMVAFCFDSAQQLAAQWQQTKAGGGNLSGSAASFYFLYRARAVPIVSLYAPDKLTLFQAALNEMASGLAQQQMQDADDLARFVNQQKEIGDSFDKKLDEQMARAQNERDPVVRDNLWRLAAIGMMRADPEKALTLAANIDDPTLRKQTEDDVRLIMSANNVRQRNFDNARLVSLKLNDLALRARTLAAIAVANKTKTQLCDSTLLEEAYGFAAKDEVRPEKVRVILAMARHFSTCGLAREFELTSSAIDAANSLPKSTSPVDTRPQQRNRVVTSTVVGPEELSSEITTTRESLTFEEIQSFADKDFEQATSLGYRLNDAVLRAKYFTSLAQGILSVNVETGRRATPEVSP